MNGLTSSINYTSATAKHWAISLIFVLFFIVATDGLLWAFYNTNPISYLNLCMYIAHIINAIISRTFIKKPDNVISVASVSVATSLNYWILSNLAFFFFYFE
jgi:hypothetical protein